MRKYLFSLMLCCLPLGLWAFWSSPGAVIQNAEKAAFQGHIAEAEEMYLEALERYPESGELAYNLGRVYYEAGAYDKAAAQFLNAQQAHFDVPENQYNLGNSFFQIGEYQKAIEAYEKALEQQSDFPACEHNLNIAQQKLQQQQQSQDSQQKQDDQNQSGDQQQNQNGDSQEGEGSENPQESTEQEQNQTGSSEGNESQEQQANGQQGEPGNQAGDSEQKFSMTPEQMEKWLEAQKDAEQRMQRYFDRSSAQPKSQPDFANMSFEEIQRYLLDGELPSDKSAPAGKDW